MSFIPTSTRSAYSSPLSIQLSTSGLFLDIAVGARFTGAVHPDACRCGISSMSWDTTEISRSSVERGSSHFTCHLSLARRMALIIVYAEGPWFIIVSAMGIVQHSKLPLMLSPVHVDYRRFHPTLLHSALPSCEGGEEHRISEKCATCSEHLPISWYDGRRQHSTSTDYPRSSSMEGLRRRSPRACKETVVLCDHAYP